MTKPFAVVILGPTAAGKTEVAINVAKALHGEIISADSRQFYQGMDIGTAKPTLSERQGIPHHLLDIVPPDGEFNLSDFKSAVKALVGDITARGRLPLIVGGTGQYIRALLSGWEIPATPPNEAMRTALGEWADQIGALQLHQHLAKIDPQAAEVIEYQNVRRTIRAWEVILTTGQRFSDLRVRKDSDFDALQIGIRRPREALYARIDDRIQAMLDAGLIAEVAGLIAKEYSLDLPSMSAIGYREIAAFLSEQISLDEAIVLMKRNTRTYVRRQANWFKENDPAIKWFDYSDEVSEQVISWLRQDQRVKRMLEQQRHA